MAFHVACPVSCQRICFCALGLPYKGKGSFLGEISRVQEFLSDPCLFGVGEKSTVQVVVPRIPLPPAAVDDGFGAGQEETRSAQMKRAALQRIAAAASLAAEDYARKFEAGNLASQDASGEALPDHIGEDQGSSTIRVMCRICFSGESEGSKRAVRMLACRLCNKKYHRKCLKSWAAFRDLFHWSSWVCPSCRICEVCRRAGDPSKFMFCKRCDAAYHCYCQQPPHKKITPGPFLCARHTRCHSCESRVSGSGSSTRWWLGYTFCDACGRLFAKGKYCPVCLKVYRDSESTPMVCCDVCQHWVHCQCDDISDAKYFQFQTDRNLNYKCAACRGACYQVNDIDDAVEELWRRTDKADRNQIASLRASAGLPFQEDIFSICPYSDDEENDSVTVKCDYGRPYRFFVKGLVDKATHNTKENDKKSGKTGKKNKKKKGYQVPLIGKTEAPPENSERLHEAQQLENNLEDKNTSDTKSYETKGSEILSSSVTRSPVKYNDISFKQTVPADHIIFKDRDAKVAKISNSKSHGLELGKGNGQHISKTETMKGTKQGTKLVIHLAARNWHTTISPQSELSTFSLEQVLADGSNHMVAGREDDSRQKESAELKHVNAGDVVPVFDHEKEVKIDSVKWLTGLKHKGRPSSSMKLEKVKKSEDAELSTETSRENIAKEFKSTTTEDGMVLPERTEGITAIEEPVSESMLRNEEVLLQKHSIGTSTSLHGENYDAKLSPSFSGSFLKDPKSLLKLKFKNPYFESQNSWAPTTQEDKNSIKGQRSKRKRSSPLWGKVLFREDESDGHMHQETKALFREDESEGHLLLDSPTDDDMDANWILKKLGKDAKGKRVEVHQSSDDTWHKGTIIDINEGTTLMSVRFDDGRSKTLELGKQGVRFISQKQKMDRM